MEKIKDFTQGKIFSPLIRFALPVLLALFLQALYGAVDLLIVGQYSDTANVSAVSTGSQILHTVTVVIVSFSMGITVLLGQKIGEGETDYAGKIIGCGILLFAIVGLVVTVICCVLTEGICTVMQAPKDAFKQTVDYSRICFIGMIFIVAFNVLGSVFRGLGDSKMPLITVAISCVVNVVGDLVLVAGLNMGAKGAAIATVFAQAFSVLVSLGIIFKRKLPFKFNLSCIKLDKAISLRIFKIGLPMALQDFLVGISFLVIMAIVNSLGVTQSAGVGVAEKLCAFIMLIPSAFMQSMSAFVAQNIGARRIDRANKSLQYGIITSFVVGILMFYLAFFHGDILSKIFSTEQDVIFASASYLKAYGIDCLLTCFLFCFIGYYSGIGSTTFVMIQGVVGAFLVRIPIAFFVSKINGVTLFKIGLATPCSTVVQIALCLIFFFFIKNKLKETL